MAIGAEHNSTSARLKSVYSRCETIGIPGFDTITGGDVLGLESLYGEHPDNELSQEYLQGLEDGVLLSKQTILSRLRADQCSQGGP